MKMKILVTDPIAAEGLEILRKAGAEVEEAGTLDTKTLTGRIRGFDALLVRSATRVDREVIAAADKLKVIGRAGVGLDNVALEPATEKGIIVMNSPEGNTVSTAEHAFALIMSLLRNIPAACASVRAGRWEKKKFVGTEATGKVLGIIGFGRIGQRVAQYGRAFEMKVLAYDPFVSERQSAKSDVTLVEKEALLREADIVTLHVPLTDDNEHMIGPDELEMMPDGSFLVNCARGGLVDEAAVAAALASGKLKGAAFDVFAQEPPAADGLPALENVVATPHLGASTDEAQEKVARAICSQVVNYLVNGVITNAANLPSLSRGQLDTLLPYMRLAEKLGRFLAQAVSGKIEEAELAYCGEIADLDVASLPHYFLKGLLEVSLGTAVNHVNAPLVAREKGLRFSEIKTTTMFDFSSVITAVVRSGSQRVAVSGTLFGRKDPRIVKIDEYLVDAVPEGILLLCRNDDRAGIIGQLGNILAAAGINIAGMTLGRSEKGGPAVTILNLDASVTAPVLAEIRRVPHVQNARLIKL